MIFDQFEYGQSYIQMGRDIREAARMHDLSNTCFRKLTRTELSQALEDLLPNLVNTPYPIDFQILAVT